MTKLNTRLGLAALATLAIPATAQAHEGDHSEILSVVAHWLTSPSHALFATLGVIGAAAVLYYINKKRA